MLNSALEYAALNWHIVPLWEPAGPDTCSCPNGSNPDPELRCSSVGKHPRTMHGLSDATTDVDTITRWWTQWPKANIGVNCGKSGLIVVDVDPRHGGDEDWRDCQERYGQDITATVTAITGGGGEHYVYVAPQGYSVGNISNSDRYVGPLGRGVDVRASGGYFVAPPSRHASGKRYEWDASPFDTKPARVPLPLLEVLSTPPSQNGNKEPISAARILEGVQEGGRDWALFQLASKLRYADVPIDMAYYLIEQAALNCKPPFPRAEARDKVNSAYKRYEPGAGAFVGPDAEPDGTLLWWRHQLDEMPELEWMIEGFAEKDALGVMVGKEGHAKTFLLLDMACCIATGTRWHGRDVKQGTVVYVYSEGFRGLRRRVRAWEASNGVTADNIAFVPRAIQLLDKVDVEYLINSIKKEAGDDIAMVVIDTLARALVGGDENNQKDIGVAIAAADHIKRALKCAVWFAHHTNRAREYRGSSVIPGSADNMVMVRKGDKKGVDDHVITVHCEKMKNAEEFEDFELVMTAYGDSIAMESENTWAAMKRKTDAIKEVDRKVLACLEDGYSFTEWMKASALGRNTFNLRRDSLVEAKMVTRDREGRYFHAHFDGEVRD